MYDRRTNLDGSNTEAAGLKNEANATGRNSFTKTTNYPPCHQHILHFSFSSFSVNFFPL